MLNRPHLVTISVDSEQGDGYDGRHADHGDRGDDDLRHEKTFLKTGASAGGGGVSKRALNCCWSSLSEQKHTNVSFCSLTTRRNIKIHHPHHDIVECSIPNL